MKREYRRHGQSVSISIGNAVWGTWKLYSVGAGSSRQKFWKAGFQIKRCGQSGVPDREVPSQGRPYQWVRGDGTNLMRLTGGDSGLRFSQSTGLLAWRCNILSHLVTKRTISVLNAGRQIRWFKQFCIEQLYDQQCFAARGRFQHPGLRGGRSNRLMRRWSLDSAGVTGSRSTTHPHGSLMRHRAENPQRGDVGV